MNLVLRIQVRIHLRQRRRRHDVPVGFPIVFSSGTFQGFTAELSDKAKELTKEKKRSEYILNQLLPGCGRGGC